MRNGNQQQGQANVMAPLHIAALSAGLSALIPVLGCAAQQSRSMLTEKHATDGTQTMRFYDETTYYNAVKNRWFGLGDYATDQPGR
jgi:hypothetical protein